MINWRARGKARKRSAATILTAARGPSFLVALQGLMPR
jgi:hypothetical protein